MSGQAHHRGRTYGVADLDADLRHGACVDHPVLPPSTWDGHVDGEDDVARADRILLALAVCAACPVAAACAAEHARGAGGGVRAGVAYVDAVGTVSLNGRDTGAQVGSRQRPACGTPGGARAHRYRGEDVCAPCDLAHREWDRDRAAIRRENRRAS